MLEDLRVVYELQATDDRLAKFASERAGLAETMDRAEKRVGEAEKALEETKKALEEKQKTYRDLDRDLKDVEENIRKFKRQEYDVKTNEELWAIQSEIRQLEEKKSDLEDRALTAIDEIEAQTASVGGAEKSLEARVEESRREKGDVERRLARLDQEEAAARKDREQRQAEVPEELLKRYERLRTHNNGVAVAVVKNRACGGCFRLITPQDVNLIRRKDRLMFCEGCGAFLVWTDGGEEETGGAEA